MYYDYLNGRSVRDLTPEAHTPDGSADPRPSHSPGAVVLTADEAVITAAGLRSQVVIKPLDGNHGRGVTTGLTGVLTVRNAFDLEAAHSRRVVEEQLPDRDHRILIVDGQVLAAAERIRALEIGDGVQLVAQLVRDVAGIDMLAPDLTPVRKTGAKSTNPRPSRTPPLEPAHG